MSARDLDLVAEGLWAELILADQDMRFVMQLIQLLPAGTEDNPSVILGSVGIVTTYCKPFTINQRWAKIGEAWLHVFNDEELALHKRALTLRDQDLAHTDSYPGRVHVKIEGVTASLQENQGSASASNPNIEGDIKYFTRTSIRGFTRRELMALAPMANKLRAQIDIQSRLIAPGILLARKRAGYKQWFQLGEAGDPGTTTQK